MYENTGDLMLLLDLQDKRLLSELDSFFSGGDVGRYADICAFHATDSYLALSLRETEAELLRALRGNGGDPSATTATG